MKVMDHTWWPFSLSCPWKLRHWPHPTHRARVTLVLNIWGFCDPLSLHFMDATEQHYWEGYQEERGQEQGRWKGWRSLCSLGGPFTGVNWHVMGMQQRCVTAVYSVHSLFAWSFNWYRFHRAESVHFTLQGEAEMAGSRIHWDADKRAPQEAAVYLIGSKQYLLWILTMVNEIFWLQNAVTLSPCNGSAVGKLMDKWPLLNFYNISFV